MYFVLGLAVPGARLPSFGVFCFAKSLFSLQDLASWLEEDFALHKGRAELSAGDDPAVSSWQRFTDPVPLIAPCPLEFSSRGDVQRSKRDNYEGCF